MNKLPSHNWCSKTMVLLLVVLGGYVGLLSAPQETYAATNASISPSSGTLHNTFALAIVVNTNGESINGVAVDVLFSGPMRYSGKTDGNACDASVSLTSAGKLRVTCWRMIDEGNPPNSYFTGTGTVVTLTFVPTGTGTATVTLANLDIASGTPGSVSGGTYQIDTTGLPDTGIAQDVALIGSGVLFLLGAGYVAVKKNFGNRENVVILRRGKTSRDSCWY